MLEIKPIVLHGPGCHDTCWQQMEIKATWQHLTLCTDHSDTFMGCEEPLLRVAYQFLQGHHSTVSSKSCTNIQHCMRQSVFHPETWFRGHKEGKLTSFWGRGVSIHQPSRAVKCGPSEKCQWQILAFLTDTVQTNLSAYRDRVRPCETSQTNLSAYRDRVRPCETSQHQEGRWKLADNL